MSRAEGAGAPAKGDGEGLFDPQFLAQLRLLFFKLRKRQRLQRTGPQATSAAGTSREFKDHRPYFPGNDYRAIDWRLFARLERLFVRVFEEVQEFHVHVLLDTSRSMAEPHREKRVVALRLASALTYLSLLNQHRVSILSLSDEVSRLLPPLKGPGHIHGVLERLGALEFALPTDLEGCLARFRPGSDRRGVVFLISDLFGTAPEAAETALQRARSWPAETHVIHVVHPREANPALAARELVGEVLLEEVETREQRRFWLTRADLERCAAAFDRFQEGIERLCARQEMNYLAWATDQPFEARFLALLERGTALAGK